ncbi:hypothetical protein VDGL01_08352 [Verticillium dahliae]
MTDSLDRYVVGVVWVHQSLVQRPLPGDPHNWEKTEDPRDVQKLVNYFNDVGADRVRLRAAEFQVWGRIAGEALEQLTASLQVSKSVLRETVTNGKHLHLRGDFSIQCFGNGHLLDVAATWSGDECWPVRLHCFDLDPSHLRRYYERLASQSCLGLPPTDGEICQHVLKYWHLGKPLLRKAWEAQIRTKPKRKCLAALFGHCATVDALIKLVPFEGLWPELKLGNWQKISAARCDEMVAMYLIRMHQVWEEILGGGTHLPPLLDLQSVRLVQGRAPCASTDDRDFIQRKMSNGELFRHVTDSAERDVLLGNILKVRGIICSFELFDGNMKYMSIGAKILKTMFTLSMTDKATELADRTETSISYDPPRFFGEIRAERPTLYSSLRELWDNTRSPVSECEEGVFTRLTGPPCAEAAFLGLILPTLRHFPRLSREGPLSNAGSNAIAARVDDAFVQALYRRADTLGFRHSRIDQSRTNSLSQWSGIMAVDQRSMSMPANWRYGKPSLVALLALQHDGFWVANPPVGSTNKHLTPSFVFQDLITSFFGTLRWDVDERAPPIHVSLDDHVRHRSAGPQHNKSRSSTVSLHSNERPIGSESSSSHDVEMADFSSPLTAKRAFEHGHASSSEVEIRDASQRRRHRDKRLRRSDLRGDERDLAAWRLSKHRHSSSSEVEIRDASQRRRHRDKRPRLNTTRPTRPGRPSPYRAENRHPTSMGHQGQRPRPANLDETHPHIIIDEGSPRSISSPLQYKNSVPRSPAPSSDDPTSPESTGEYGTGKMNVRQTTALAASAHDQVRRPRFHSAESMETDKSHPAATGMEEIRRRSEVARTMNYDQESSPRSITSPVGYRGPLQSTRLLDMATQKPDSTRSHPQHTQSPESVADTQISEPSNRAPTSAKGSSKSIDSSGSYERSPLILSRSVVDDNEAQDEDDDIQHQLLEGFETVPLTPSLRGDSLDSVDLNGQTASVVVHSVNNSPRTP